MSPLATIQRIFENCGDVDRWRKKYSIASSAIEHQREQWSASPFGWNDVLETTNVVRRPLYCVRVSDRDRRRGSIIAIEVSFGFMEEPNVERLLQQLARHKLRSPRLRQLGDVGQKAHLAVNVVFEFVNNEFLFGNYSFEQVADGDNTDHFVSFYHRQMTHTLFSHQSHT